MVQYRYAIVREIVAFATFTINFFYAPENNGFFFKMSKNKCIFSAKWLSQESYKPWLKEFKGDKQKCLCSLCDKLIDIGTMGESALKSHMKSERHKNRADVRNDNECIKSFFAQKPCGSPQALSTPKQDANNNELCTPAPPTQPSVPCHTTALTNFIVKDTVLRAEILWTLRLIATHQSYKSSENTDKLFKEMFPDSKVATQFRCGERKAA
jgi:hypothetical protein